MKRTVVITGASNGIGEALALRYAGKGARLGLVGRNRERLAAVAERCRALGAEPSIAAIDVRERASLKQWLDEFDDAAPVDILIANAGILTGTGGGSLESADTSFLLFETNVVGALNTVHPLLPRMLSRRRGTIALMSSIAGFGPLPQMPSYSASKSAVLTYGLALRQGLRSHGVRVSVICPGYVDTEMSLQVRGQKLFMLSAEKAAARIVRGIEQNRAIIAFPRRLAIATRLHGFLPDWARRLTSPFVRFSAFERK